MKKVFPTLYAKASTGKVKVWKIRAESTGMTAAIITDYGYEDSEELQSTTVEVNKGKNLGKANETSPFEQACLQAESKWNKKQDKKYVEDSSGESDKLLPMLALDYKKRGKDIEYPAYVQPKLDGVRCLAQVKGRKVIYTSRGGKEFTTLDHLTPYILSQFKNGEILDGEIFTEALTFQETVSAVKRKQEDSEKLEYWIYDLVVPSAAFKDREKTLRSRLTGETGPLVQVPTRIVPTEERMKEFHGKVVQEGFEGTIIRNLVGEYKKDFRSKDLQKYKDFFDEEFKIVGAKEGVGKFKGAVTWLCVQEEGKEFDCTPKGTMEQKQNWWQNHQDYIGKMITVRYQTRTDDNKPLFPVGLAIRDYE